METATEGRTEAAFWNQQMAIDPAEATLELRMEITSATVLAVLFFIFGACTLLGLLELPDEDRLFWIWAEIITSASLFAIMVWAISLVLRRKGSLREMESQVR